MVNKVHLKAGEKNMVDLSAIAKYGNTVGDCVSECMDTWRSNHKIMRKAFDDTEYARCQCVDMDIEIDNLGATFSLEQYIENNDNTAFYNALSETGLTEEELQLELHKLRDF
jgi:hypothetical protein